MIRRYNYRQIKILLGFFCIRINKTKFVSGKIFKEEKQEVKDMDPDEIRPRLLNKKVIQNS